MVDKNKEDLILDASFKLFSKFWYKKVSVDNITKEAWVAKGTFYLYFKNKDDLYKILIDSIMDFHLCQVDDFAKKVTDVKERVYKDLYYSLKSLEKSSLIRNIIQWNKDFYSESIDALYFEEKWKIFADKILWGLPPEFDKEKLWNYIIMIIGSNSYLIWMKDTFNTEDEYEEFLKDYIAMIVTWLFSDFEKNKYEFSQDDKNCDCPLLWKRVCFAKIKNFINKFKD